MFLIQQGGRQKVLIGHVNSTIDNVHEVKLFWDDRYQQAGLKVDGVIASPREKLYTKH